MSTKLLIISVVYILRELRQIFVFKNVSAINIYLKKSKDKIERE